MESHLGKWIVLIGLLIVIVGAIVILFGDKLSWIGKLPGDILVERDNFKFYFPITTMILFSIVLNIVWKLIKNFIP